MEFYEIRSLMKYEYLAYKESWEQARLIAYTVAQVNSKKKLKLSDIMNFYWDNEQDKDKSSNNIEMSNSELERLQKMAEQYINNN